MKTIKKTREIIRISLSVRSIGLLASYDHDVIKSEPDDSKKNEQQDEKEYAAFGIKMILVFLRLRFFFFHKAVVCI